MVEALRIYMRCVPDLPLNLLPYKKNYYDTLYSEFVMIYNIATIMRGQL